MWQKIVERIDKGEIVQIRPSGSSMSPRIKSKQLVTLTGVNTTTLQLGDIVLAKVKGRFFLHLISAIDGDRIQISNNHGHVNGWTHSDKVFAIVSAIE